MSKVRRDGDCWLWTGCAYGGYGQFKMNGRAYWAHRTSYAVFHGHLPPRLTVHHRCRNTLCVNPDHLELIPHSDNVADGNRYRNGEPC